MQVKKTLCLGIIDFHEWVGNGSWIIYVKQWYQITKIMCYSPTVIHLYVC